MTDEFLREITSRSNDQIYQGVNTSLNYFFSKIYSKLQERYDETLSLGNNSNFLENFIKETLEVPVNSIVRGALSNLETEINGVSTYASRMIDEDYERAAAFYVDNANKSVSSHLNFSRLDELGYEFSRNLNNTLMRKLETVMSRNLENGLEEMCYDIKRIINNEVEYFITSVNDTVRTNCSKREEQVLEAVNLTKRDGRRLDSEECKFIEGFDEYIFMMGSDKVKISIGLDGGTTVYINDKMVKDPVIMGSLGDELLKKFPEQADLINREIVVRAHNMQIVADALPKINSIGANALDASFFDEPLPSEEALKPFGEDEEAPVKASLPSDVLDTDFELPMTKESHQVEEEQTLQESIETSQLSLDEISAQMAELEKNPEVQKYMFLMELAKVTLDAQRTMEEVQQTISETNEMMESDLARQFK